MQYRLEKTDEYEEWIEGETHKSRAQIAKRLEKIEQDGYFGLTKDLDDDLWELKWDNGRRVYYAIIPEKQILLLLGGNKNGQSKDITQARKILRAYTED